jgi:hypothetical protein
VNQWRMRQNGHTLMIELAYVFHLQSTCSRSTQVYINQNRSADVLNDLYFEVINWF